MTVVLLYLVSVQVHGKRYAYKFDFAGLAQAMQPPPPTADPTAAFKYRAAAAAGSELFLPGYHPAAHRHHPAASATANHFSLMNMKAHRHHPSMTGASSMIASPPTSPFFAPSPSAAAAAAVTGYWTSHGPANLPAPPSSPTPPPPPPPPPTAALYRGLHSAAAMSHHVTSHLTPYTPYS